MEKPPNLNDEFRGGWRIVLGAAIAAGTGFAAVLLNFSMFVLPLAQELNVSRGEVASAQALIVTAALGAPVFGRMSDRFGVRTVFVVCTLVAASVYFLAATLASNLFHIGMTVAAIGFFGIGSTAVVLSRPITEHFMAHRGKALGLMAVGTTVVTMATTPVLQWLLETWGWRSSFLSFAVASVLIGIPAVLMLFPKSATFHKEGTSLESSREDDQNFMFERDFWLLALSFITMSLATAGMVSQLVPVIVDEGVDAGTAILAISFFAGGQFVGKLASGWLLDMFEPRSVAFILTLVPITGFIVLLITHGIVPAALLAAAFIGMQLGAEVDIFAYFVSHRFATANYGSIYGALVGLGWIGNVTGMLWIGYVYDWFGSYAPAQLTGIIALVISATLFLMVSLPDTKDV
jgi:MFS family permease